MRRYYFIFPLVVLGLALSVQGVKAADSCTITYCNEEQLEACKTSGYHWGQACPADHYCSWSGLTISCYDLEYKYCDLDGGGRCYLQPEVNENKYLANPRTVPGIYQVADFVTQFVRLSQWGLAFVTVLAVLMFVWAGWEFITAAGRSSMIEEGKKIIGGTITGIIIAFSAYIIVNFSIVALTGASVKSSNIWAGPVALLFPNDSSLSRPFSGTQSEDTRTNCRSSNNDAWDKGCSDHIYCADTGTGSTGDVALLQKRLNGYGCNCGTVDGCYGPKVVDCVRRFQASNMLPLSGEIDARTAAAIMSADPITCDAGTSEGLLYAPIMSKLPTAVYPPDTASNTNTGACVINQGDNSLYCLDNVRETTCLALGKDNFFYNGLSANSPSVALICGYCQTQKVAVVSPDSFNCFEYATKYWCENIASDTVAPTNNLSFRSGSCQSTCSRGDCRTTLLIHPR